MRSHYLRKTAYLTAFLGIMACGENEENQVVQKFSYDVGENSVNVAVEFNKDFELNTDIYVPIRVKDKEYGEVVVKAADADHGFSIGAGINFDAFVDEEIFSIEKTKSLPNGQPMSSYVQDPVARFRAVPHEQVATSVYLGVDPTRLYLGTAIELTFMGKDFPSGLVISQRIRDKQNRMLGVITIYGPQVENGEVKNPGGIFFMTNVTDLVKIHRENQNTVFAYGSPTQGLMAEDNTYVSDAHRDMLSDRRQFLKLMKLYRKKAKEADLID